MAGMAMGRDGSTGELRMGHDFICVSLVGPDFPEALPVYAKLGRGRKGHAGMLSEAIGAVMGQTGGAGWIVEDRDMDGAEHLRDLKRDDRRVEIRCRPGVVQYSADPKSKDAATEDVNVLVVESRFDEEFALEKARVRTFRRLENIFTLCVMAYVYATQFLRGNCKTSSRTAAVSAAGVVTDDPPAGICRRDGGSTGFCNCLLSYSPRSECVPVSESVRTRTSS